MLKTIIIILVFSSCSNLPCDPAQEEIEKALNVLHSRKILDLSNNELNIKLPAEYSSYISKEEIKVGDKKIKLFVDKVSVPTVNFTDIKKENDRSIKILFVASEAGYRYRGEILFECKNDVLVYKDIHYLSEIN